MSLTRAKKNIQKASFEKEDKYISKLKNESSRCYKRSKNGFGKYIGSFEVKSSDIDLKSLARNTDVQNYIENLPPNTRLKFIKDKKIEGNKPRYRIVPEDDESLTLGYTTTSFAKDIKQTLLDIWKKSKSKNKKNRKNPNSVGYRYYPAEFQNIYVNSLNTHISAFNDSMHGAKRKGDLCLWYGISVSGFATASQENY